MLYVRHYMLYFIRAFNIMLGSSSVIFGSFCNTWVLCYQHYMPYIRLDDNNVTVGPKEISKYIKTKTIDLALRERDITSADSESLVEVMKRTK